MRASVVCSSLAALVLLGSPLVRADVDSAKGYVKEAEELIEKGSNSDMEKAGTKLELAETELDGVAEAAKAPVQAAIKAAKAKIAGAAAAADKPMYLRQLSRAMDDAEGSIGNLATWPTAEREFNDVFNNEKAKVVIQAELEAASKKFATFKKLNAKKSIGLHAEEIKTGLKYIEEKWVDDRKEMLDPDTSANNKAEIAESTVKSINELRKRISDQLPADDETAKAIGAKLDAIAQESTKLGLAGRIKEVVETLKRQFDLYKDDWNGYEKETKGPTWKEYQSISSAEMSRFLGPKSAEFLMRTDDFLEHLKEDEDYKSVASDPKVKAIVDGAKAKRDAVAVKLVSFVTPIVDEALKSAGKEANVIDNLESNVRLTLGEKSPEGMAMRARLKKKSEDTVAAATGAEDAKVKLIEMLRKKAESEYPNLYAGMTWIDKIDLSKPGALKGKNIGFLSDNLMGYRFKPCDYYFATTIGGIPVAATMDPMLKKQIDATEKAIGRSLGDDDSDGKWDIVAVVTDKKTKLMAIRTAESTGKVDGVDVKIDTKYSVPVEAIVIEIIAAKCGPFAGVKGKGVLKEDGTIGK